MPQRVTMRARSAVARSKSFEAPVVIWCMNTSSAMRPPNSTAIVRQHLVRGPGCSGPRSGSCMVTPSARPRGMMVTLCTGSVLGSSSPTIAWPDSWYAVLRRSSSGITIDVRSAPMMILSLACSKSSMSTRRLLPRAANSAASLTRLARSAPEKPGVPRAMMSALTSGASGTLRMCTLRICSRPRMSGSGTTTWRSKRPGPQQRRVEHVGAVGRGDDDHAHGAPRSRPSRPAAGSASARARRCRRPGRRRAGGRPRRFRR